MTDASLAVGPGAARPGRPPRRAPSAPPGSARRRLGAVPRLLLSRLGFGVLTLLAVSVVVFLATQALPGDAAQAILGREATPERLAALREQLDLGGNWFQQYGAWIVKVVSLDLGLSLTAGIPVSDLLLPSLVSSGVLMLIAALIAIPVAIGVGTWSALRQGRAGDHLTSVLTLVLASLPEFVVGVFLILLLSTGLFQLFPAVVVLAPGAAVWSSPEQLVLPVLTLVLAVSPYIIRIMRGTMLEVLDSPYVQQARLKGLPERRVITRHAIPNAIGPVAQVIALQLAWLVGGVVIIEYLFRYPGIGFLLIDGVTNRDVP
ncbi:ABC transporter permease, partial [Leucobacter sp. M11]|uniref:ABC transporter permease n=1 Tax=Leucobacter sp. M11 TaxID=2993565 RepID=UPI002D7F8EB2